ncbi:hypothetical protein B0A49_08443 [Cryomyces minteri]|uniref:Uncharacterized protein n=1 Tax=Cryomyces minteri TaxID=331657 RepID=A0A4U0XE97_9PEZI|nr:hypothetical protein B0A49_08443 [Cryomyces minteri]
MITFAACINMSPSIATAVKESIPAAEAAASSPTPSGVEPRLPPSPPLSSSPSITSKEQSESVSKLLRLLQDLKAGNFTEQPPWDKRRLLREEYIELWERLDEDEGLKAWVEHKLRYDYDHDTQHFIIRMPTRLHDTLIARVVARLKEQLDTISSTNAEVRKTIKKISPGMQWTVPLSFTPRSPDYVFGFMATYWPPLVLEISYSQKREDLDDLAYSYVHDSGGEIKTAIGLDIEYTPPRGSTKTKKATLNVWRYGSSLNNEGREISDCTREVNDEPFRSEDGNSLQGNLALTLADFLPPHILPTITPANRDLPITIPFDHLTSDLEQSEAEMDIMRRGRSGLTPPKIWAERKRAPEEELDTGRERKYQAVEEAEERKASQEDSDYSPPRRVTQEQEPEPVAADRRIAIPRRSSRRSRG